MNVIDGNILTALLETSYSKTWTESESSTDSDIFLESDEPPNKKKKLRTKIHYFVEQTVLNYSEFEFKTHFHMSRKTTYRLIGLLSTCDCIPVHTYGRQKITPEKAFLLVLWYFGNLETFRQIADRFDVTYSAAHSTLKRITKFLLDMKSKIIKWPNPKMAKIINTEFKKKQGLRNIIGAIDCSHIEIPKPVVDPLDYVNKKGYHSLLLQAVVDSNKKFIDVFCGEPGSLHDSSLLRKSGLYRTIMSDPEFIGDNIILGDAAYPNLNWLVTPFKDNGRLSQNQKIFNYRISATRVIVEIAFGCLKGRFHQLKKLDNTNLKLCSEIIMSCCVLHNICVDDNDIFNEDITGDSDQPKKRAYGSSSNADDITRQMQVFNEMFEVR